MLSSVCRVMTSGTWDWTKIVLLSGSIPAASQSKTISSMFDWMASVSTRDSTVVRA